MADELRRPNPDRLLARLKAQEAQEAGETRKTAGKLKVFLGYAPGVGKTYTMLEEARLKKDADVAIAVAETHGRVETEALLKGMEIIARKQVDYRGIKLSEMDLDAVLKRHPKLALVDELAHENAPGSRHAKRYQDVQELLDAGIDVYTTLNVQHIESVRDVVAQVIGVWVHETVPDSIIDNASEIEMVDLPPDELLARLKDGKVYVPEQIAVAIEKFFRKGNLTALRELTMRTAAKHVDEDTLAYMRAHGIEGIWPSGERLLLVLGPDSSGPDLVRAARRLAYELGAIWSAVSVETSNGSRLSTGQQDSIMNSLRLAQSLGARTPTVSGDDVPATILRYARENNITKIVVAKPTGGLWQRLTGRSLANEIVRGSQNMDVHLVGTGSNPTQAGKPSPPERVEPVRALRGYLSGSMLVALATVLGKLAPQFFDAANLITVYLLCVVVTAVLWGFGPSIAVSVLSVLIFDFLFVPPFFTFTVYDTKYLLTFSVFLGVGLTISYLVRRIGQHTEVVARHERQTAALYGLGRELATSNDLESYIHAITNRVKDTFGRPAVVFLPDPNDKEWLRPHSESPATNIGINELAAARWSFQNRKMSGPGTSTLPNAEYLYVPLVTPRGAVGILALSAAGATNLTIEQEQLLEAFADLAAIAIESMISNPAPKPPTPGEGQ